MKKMIFLSILLLYPLKIYLTNYAVFIPDNKETNVYNKNGFNKKQIKIYIKAIFTNRDNKSVFSENEALLEMQDGILNMYIGDDSYFFYQEGAKKAGFDALIKNYNNFKKIYVFENRFNFEKKFKKIIKYKDNFEYCSLYKKKLLLIQKYDYKYFFAYLENVGELFTIINQELYYIYSNAAPSGFREKDIVLAIKNEPYEFELYIYTDISKKRLSKIKNYLKDDQIKFLKNISKLIN